MPQIQANDITIHYQWDGPADGPVIMLSHSLGADLTMWDPQVEPLTSAGYRVLRYDTRGHGGSSVPDAPYSMEMLTRDAVALMDALGLNQVIFCGLSMGGMIGQMLGSAHGDRIKELVLCSTSPHMPPKAVWEERIQAVREHGLAKMVDTTIDRWFTRTGQERMPEAVDKIRKVYVQSPPEGFAACCAAIRDMDLRETNQQISAPTLIMVGEHDEGTPVAHAKLIHERIPQSRLVVVADAAHLQNVEQAAVFNKTLIEFLNVDTMA